MKGILRVGLLALVAVAAGLPAWAARTISVNFNSKEGTAPEGYGLVPAKGWNNLTGASGNQNIDTAGAADAHIEWSAPGIWAWTDVTDGALKGYLDDNSSSSRIKITISQIPFECYDVIIYQATDDPAQFNPPKINGYYYSYDGLSKTTTERSSAMRYGQSYGLVAEYGRNVVWVHNLSGDLELVGCMPKFASSILSNSEGRGCIAALQIVEGPTHHWGNFCRTPGAGCIERFDRQDMCKSYDFTFGDQTGLRDTGIGMQGDVIFRMLKLVLGDDNRVAPKSVTISDGESTMKLTSCSIQTNVAIYGTSTAENKRQVATYVFGPEMTFDAGKKFTMTFDGDWRGTVAQPVNKTFSDGSWSPVFQLVGAYTAPRSIAVNFNSAQGEARSGSGVAPAETWNNVVAASTNEMVLVVSDGTASGAQLTSSGKTSAWTGATEPLLKGYIDDGDVISIAVDKIPFDYYDVIVYQATDTENDGFHPPSINGRYYSYDGTQIRTAANDCALRYGSSRQLGPFYGQNTCYIRGGFSGDLKIVGAGNQYNARGCIAGIQIVEAEPPPEYSATVSADTAWEDIRWYPTPQNGLESNAQLTLTVSGKPTITFKESVSFGANSRLTVKGAPVVKWADSAYVDGSWETSILTVSTNETSEVTFAPIKEGFVGEYEKSELGFSLRAQNREIIAVNFAGGRLDSTSEPTDSPAANRIPQTGDLFGLAPVAGTNWNEIAKQWKNEHSTVTLSGVKAFDGTNVVRRETVSVSASAKSTSQTDDVTDVLLRGYLDDETTPDASANVVISGLPYTAYDLIVYGTADGKNVRHAPVIVNGTSYTFTNGATVVGTADWGEGLYAQPAFGKNALRIPGLVGDTVTISGVRTSNGRFTFGAVQIVNQGEITTKQTYAATITESTQFKDIQWDHAFCEGQLNEATVTVSDAREDEVEIVFDNPDITLGKIIIISNRDLRLTAESALANVGHVDLSRCTGKITYDYPVDSLKMSTDGRHVYVGGSGTEAKPATIAFLSEGKLKLSGDHAPYFIGTTYDVSATDMPYAMFFANAVVYANGAINDAGDTGLGIGQATVTVAGTSVVTAQSIALSHGQDGLEYSSLTIKDEARVVATGTANQDTNRNAVVFGAGNGPTTFTLQDAAAFTAASDVLVGLTGNDHTINVFGGTFTARGIRASSRATGTNRINLNGGELVLGASGISSYGTTTIPVTVDGDARIASLADLSITQDVTINEGKTLTFAAADGVITLSGNIENNGTNVIASGTVRLALANKCAYQGDGLIIVKRGATLDYCGNCPDNLVVVEEGGAVVNSGSAMTADNLLRLSLAGDATLGGPSEIRFGSQAQIAFNGHTLTVSREGRLSLATLSLADEAKIVVGTETSKGTLATAGSSLLASIDVEVASAGVLDLSVGKSLTCRDFRSEGTVEGTAATLVVTRTLDATTTTRVTNLALADGAKLVGEGLLVSDKLTLGSVLYVESSAIKPGTIAVVPVGTTVNETTLVYNGRRYYRLACSGNNLSVVFYSNNWIDYADFNHGVSTTRSAYLVTNAVGLAWIAEVAATNKLFKRAVKLDADIDLSQWNWTPIREFSGTFDGQGHVIKGLNNTNIVEEYGERARYYGGTTNEMGYVSYGLFASATNATIKNVTFEDVAISNAADSVAVLLGVHAAGTLTVQGVTVRSGSVKGSGRAVAGILTVGCAENTLGKLVVTGNVNHASMGCTLSSAAPGGNVAQILAGATWGTKFGTVDVSMNEGLGKFDVSVTDDGRTEDWDKSFFAWMDLPVCNFAPVVMQTLDDGNFLRFVEATDKGAVPIDPVKKTARLSAGNYPNGAVNMLGNWIDTITAAAKGAKATIDPPGTVDCWTPIAIDRDIEIDMNGSTVYGVYDCDLFTLSENVKLTLRNGTLLNVEGYDYFRRSEGASVVEDRVTKKTNSGTFYERTVGVEAVSVSARCVSLAVPYTSQDFAYTVQHVNALAEEWKDSEDPANVLVPGTGSEMSFEVENVGEAGFYRVIMTPNW